MEQSKLTLLISELQMHVLCLSLPEQVEALNAIRLGLHQVSPFGEEPVDCILWVPNEKVFSNDYNPNSVAPPEMELLKTSILEDGYTQPIVGWNVENGTEVVDGFHRNRVGKECSEVRKRIHSYLPIAYINGDREDKGDRIAATIRHNRARGKHKVEAMSDIVIELKRRNWSDERIAKNLGMEQDEILRLCQITGLTDIFKDQEFSKSWDVEGEITETDFKELTDEVETYGAEVAEFRTVNTSDSNRIFHTYEKWECYKAGFYATTKDGMCKEECEIAYRDFLKDDNRFAKAMEGVIHEWKNSCEHYLTNTATNRIAWMGQAAVCYAMGIPSEFRSGFSLLTEADQEKANQLALVYLNKWCVQTGRPTLTLEEAYSGDRQSAIY